MDDLEKEIELIEYEDGEEDWTSIDVPSKVTPIESIQDRIVRVTNDLRDLTAYYDIDGSASRNGRLEVFFRDELADLERQSFDSYSSQDDRVDHLLLRNYMRRARRTLRGRSGAARALLLSSAALPRSTLASPAVRRPRRCHRCPSAFVFWGRTDYSVIFTVVYQGLFAITHLR